MLEFSALTLDLVADLLDGNLNEPRQPPSARVREHGGDEPLGNSEIGKGSIGPGKIRYHEKPRARTELSSAPRSRRTVANSMSQTFPGVWVGTFTPELRLLHLFGRHGQESHTGSKLALVVNVLVT